MNLPKSFAREEAGIGGGRGFGQKDFAMKNTSGSKNTVTPDGARIEHYVTHVVSDARRVTGATTTGHRNAEGVEQTALNRLLSNKLLAALSGEAFARLFPHVEPVSLAAGADVYKAGEEIHHIYFPENVVISHLHILEDGSSVEAALIGREGIVGLSAVFNAHPPSYWTQIAVAGSALRVRKEVVKNEFARGGALQELILSYASSRLAHLSQRAVCNSRHKIVERLASWLLMVHDRAGEDQLMMTHEQIARHLGTRRAGVTNVVTDLRDKHIIDYGRGHIRVLDRRALEAAACECYGVLGEVNAAAA